MKVVILAGGFGTRLSEETGLRPKPMVEIGGRPILWHIMNVYATHGITEFIIALGYKGEMIKKYFLDFYTINSDISIDLSSGATTIHKNGNQREKRTGEARATAENSRSRQEAFYAKGLPFHDPGRYC